MPLACLSLSFYSPFHGSQTITDIVPKYLVQVNIALNILAFSAFISLGSISSDPRNFLKQCINFINRHMLFVFVLVYKSPVYEKKAFDLICERLASIGYPQVI